MEKKTIRLIVPDWQAGDNPVYYFGAKILQVIAPKKEGQKEITIPVPDDFKPLERENGVTAQSAVYQQVKDTVSAIDKEAPDKIITFGGNCLVSQAPFAYLNEKYDDLGVLWVDAHPDISNPEIYENEHAMVLANLLGAGDPKLSGLVRKTLKPSQVRYEGMQGGVDVEQRGEIFRRRTSQLFNADALQNGHILSHVSRHRWLVLFAAMRYRRQIRRIRFQQNGGQRYRFRCLL